MWLSLALFFPKYANVIWLYPPAVVVQAIASSNFCFRELRREQIVFFHLFPLKEEGIYGEEQQQKRLGSLIRPTLDCLPYLLSLLSHGTKAETHKISLFSTLMYQSFQGQDPIFKTNKFNLRAFEC